ncbi:hypothetical protein ISCGN_025559 [Ixodes scapularis]
MQQHLSYQRKRRVARRSREGYDTVTVDADRRRLNYTCRGKQNTKERATYCKSADGSACITGDVTAVTPSEGEDIDVIDALVLVSFGLKHFQVWSKRLRFSPSPI